MPKDLEDQIAVMNGIKYFERGEFKIFETQCL